MTSEAKAAVDKIKREKYLAELAVQIDEQKQRRRQQKEKERQEDLRREREAAEYMPFGRHGAGAPLRDTGGRVITNLRKYNSPQYQQRRERVSVAASPPPPPAPLGDDRLPGVRLSPTEKGQGPISIINSPNRPGEQPRVGMVTRMQQEELGNSGGSDKSLLVGALQNEIADLRSENFQLRQHERDLKDQLFSAQGTIERLAARVAELNRQFSQ